MNHVIACLDGASYSLSVCDYAAWAARKLKAPLELLHVLEQPDSVSLDASGNIGLGSQELLLQALAELDERRSALAREHGRQILESAQQRAAAAGATEIRTRQRHESFIESLVELQNHARLFVLGQHDAQHKPKRFLLDQNLESAIRVLQRPVLVANASFQEPRNFMIAFDGSSTGRKTVEMVAGSPLLQGLPCQVVTVGKHHDALEWALNTLSSAGLDATSYQLEGEAAPALLDHAQSQQIELLIMGAYGHSRIRHLVVGSTTTMLLQQSTLPVLILR